jgi:hypothetical protein
MHLFGRCAKIPKLNEVSQNLEQSVHPAATALKKKRGPFAKFTHAMANPFTCCFSKPAALGESELAKAQTLTPLGQTVSLFLVFSSL